MGAPAIVEAEEGGNIYLHASASNSPFSTTAATTAATTTRRKTRKRKNRHDYFWEDMYRRLIAFKNEHGHAVVPSKYQRDPQLGKWVDNQRRVYRQNKMPEERIGLLNLLRFEWGRNGYHSHTSWDEMYQRLVDYKIEHGNTRVPKRYQLDRQLGKWVDRQRQTNRKNK